MGPLYWNMKMGAMIQRKKAELRLSSMFGFFGKFLYHFIGLKG